MCPGPGSEPRDRRGGGEGGEGGEAESPSRELAVHGSRGQGLAKRTLAAKDFIQAPDPGGKSTARQRGRHGFAYSRVGMQAAHSFDE